MNVFQSIYEAWNVLFPDWEFLNLITNYTIISLSALLLFTFAFWTKKTKWVFSLWLIFMIAATLMITDYKPIEINEGGSFSEAPEDGQIYGREDGEWSQIIFPETELPDGLVYEAPQDGKQYIRKDGVWVELVTQEKEYIEFTFRDITQFHSLNASTKSITMTQFSQYLDLPITTVGQYFEFEILPNELSPVYMTPLNFTVGSVIDGLRYFTRYTLQYETLSGPTLKYFGWTTGASSFGGFSTLIGTDSGTFASKIRYGIRKFMGGTDTINLNPNLNIDQILIRVYPLQDPSGGE